MKAIRELQHGCNQLTTMKTFGQEKLLRDFFSGKEEAVGELYRAHYQNLCYYSFRITDNMKESEDIVSRGFIALLKAPRGNFENMGAIRNFLKKVVSNASINYVKATKRFESKHIEIAENSERVTDNDFLKVELRGWINGLFELLTPQQRMIIVDHVIEGATAKEVAEKLKIHVNTLYRDKERAIQVMQSYIKDRGIQYPMFVPYLLIIMELAKRSLN